jgi:acetyltransferase-like isoleucine patch superfamily enzyme
MSKNTILRGKVKLGKNITMGDNITLGNRDDGELIIGDNAVIRSGSTIYSDVVIGSDFKCGHNILIREETRIGNGTLIGTNAVVDGHCRIGNNVSVQTGAYITVNTVLEDEVFMGPCSVTTNDRYMVRGAQLKGPIIKKGARIGANVTILQGIVIGENAVVGAGAVVTKDVELGATVAGNPARILYKASG